MTPDVVNTLFDTSRDDLATNHIAQFQNEIDRWIVGWDTAADPKLLTLLETLTVTNGDLYPNMYACLLILITMPVTPATVERCFSEISVSREELKLTSGRRCLQRDSLVLQSYIVINIGKLTLIK